MVTTVVVLYLVYIGIARSDNGIGTVDDRGTLVSLDGIAIINDGNDIFGDMFGMFWYYSRCYH